MGRWCNLLLLCLVVAAATAATTEDTTTDPTTIPTTTAKTTTTSKPTTTTSTTTTPSTTTSTTTKSTTTSTTTTTEAPTTTTSAPIPPAPVPAPGKPGTWYVKDDSKNETCLAFTAKLEVQGKNESKPVLVPNNATATGKCNGDNVTFHLSFDVEKDSVIVSCIVTKIQPSKDGKPEYRFENFTIAFNDESPVGLKTKNETFFEAPVNSSYKCTSKTVVRFADDTQLIISSLQTEAFSSNTDQTFKFSSAWECKADDVSAVVPVTVGAALIVLVVIVLVAYIIGRKRSRARGYQSV